MKEAQEKRKNKQLENAGPEESLRLARNQLASQHFGVDNYNSLLTNQKESVDNLIKGQ